jgi:hypothetical protein
MVRRVTGNVIEAATKDGYRREVTARCVVSI